MNCFLNFILLNSFAQLNSNSLGQFVTLEGRQFKIDGDDYYPMVMNYEVSITHTPSTIYYYATPAGSNGPSDDYECSDLTTCNARFQDEFDKIKSMGFNAVRVKFGPFYRYDAANSSWYFSIRYNENTSQLWNSPNYWLNLDYPTFTNIPSQNLFSIIKNFLDQADLAGIKVILIAAEDEVANPANGNIIFNPVSDAASITAYATYLSKLASEIEYHPALLAYDLWNEPFWSYMYKNSANQDYSKNEICSIERSWYDAIRQNDQNHLITIGGSSIEEIQFWDMGMLKLDFYSVHSYPAFTPYLLPTDIQGSITNGMEIFKIMCYWMSQVCPIPWIIGETGFAADDNTFPAPHLSNDPDSKLPPAMYGSEIQQSQFAEESLEAVRNGLGSGYSWWFFQNTRWNSPAVDCWPDCASQNFFGLLHYGDNTSTWYDKLAVDVFEAYPSPPPPPGANLQPYNYYDPYNIESSLNTNATNAVSGYVYDDKGNPIKDAVISGTSWLESIDAFYSPTPWILTPSNVEDDKIKYDSPFTFSFSDGSFQLVPYNYYQPTAINPHRIVNINITAVGAERYFEGQGWVGYGYGDQQMSPSNVGTITLRRVTHGYDATVTNETVNIGEIRNYYGRNSLTASSLVIDGNGANGGTSNLTARKTVELLPGFEAHAGSNVHIFISDATPNCADFSAYRNSNPATSGHYENETEKKEIEIQFSDKKNLNAVIYPNPNNGLFTIGIQNPLKGNVTILLENLMGDILWLHKSSQSEVYADFSFLAKGIYLIHIKNEEQSVVKKLIIN